MILRVPHAAQLGAECSGVSWFSTSDSCHPLRPIAFNGEDPFFLQYKRKAQRLYIFRALSPLQHDRESPNLSPAAPESVQSQLERLEKLTLGREKVDGDGSTIGEQLVKKVVVDTDDEVAIPLGKQNPLDYDDLTISQKRNIRRQKYLDQVSKRNDAPFFAAIALFVFVPPAVILGVAVATGYVNLLP